MSEKRDEAAADGPRPDSRLRADTERTEQALRDLDRLTAESETIGSSTFVRMAKRAQTHLAAGDKAGADPVEIWAARLGRAAGLIFALGLIIHLVITYL